MFRPVGSIGNLYLAKGRKEDYHRFFLSFRSLQPPQLSQSGGGLLPLHTLILSSSCVAGQACLSKLTGEDGEDQNKTTEKIFLLKNALSEHSAQCARNFAVFSVLTSVSEPHWFQCGSGSPAFYFNADPDPDPDPKHGFHLN